MQVHLQQAQERLVLRYRDDGRGFDPQNPAHQKGLGLQNLRSRLRMIGGEMDLEAAPGQGVKVHLTAPLPGPPQPGQISTIV